jgi:hypothetical protein
MREDSHADHGGGEQRITVLLSSRACFRIDTDTPFRNSVYSVPWDFLSVMISV